MKRQMLVLTLLAGALLTWGAAPARAADSLTGEVVDLACYMHDPGEHGKAHQKCAEVCVKKGMPIGLLTSDKQVYLLLEDHDNQKPYAALKDKAAETVTVEGEKVSQGGLQGLVVEVLK